MNDTFVKLPSGNIINIRYIQFIEKLGRLGEDKPYYVNVLRTFIRLGETDYKALEKVLLEGNSGT